MRVYLPPVQLVLINISDHATRISATSGGPSGDVRVLGCLLGQQAGRVVDISNSFELRHELTAEGGVMLDEAFVTKKLEQCECAEALHHMPAVMLGLPCGGHCRQADFCAPGRCGLVRHWRWSAGDRHKRA